MLRVLVFGGALIAATVVVHTFGLLILTRIMTRMVGTLRLDIDHVRKTGAMIATVLGIFAIHSVEICIWTLAYWLSGALKVFDDALYFSMMTFSTLGYGDVPLSIDWRLLSGMEGVDGFILIGWSTAYLVSTSGRYGPSAANRA